MNPFATLDWLISDAGVEQFGWVLVHSLWQFLLVALLAALSVRMMRWCSAAMRYGLLVVAMAVLVAAPVATWVMMKGDGSPAANQREGAFERRTNDAKIPRIDATGMTRDPLLEGNGGIESPSLEPIKRTSQVPSVGPPRNTAVPQFQFVAQLAKAWAMARPTWDQTKALLQPWLGWIVAVWALGVALCSTRPLLGWYTVLRLKRVGVSAAPAVLQASLHRVAQQLGLHSAVQLLQSTLAQSPMMVGYFRPVILLPVSVVTKIPPTQLEAILAHELAHVRRHDFAVNLLQTLVETLFFYHPAVWWLSRQIRIEREHCCDDFVVTNLGNRVEYGRALVAIEQLRGQNMVLALGASDGSLLSRVRRIVGRDCDIVSSRGSERWPSALLGIALIGISSVMSMTLTFAAKDEPKAIPAIKVETDGKPVKSTALQTGGIATGQWPMWGGSSHRNHLASGRMPTDWDLATGRNVLWKAPLGTAVYSSPVVSGGKVFIGTNNGAGLDPRRPSAEDLSCLVCLEQSTGKLLWQYASEKLPTGRVNDWPQIGLCSTACVEGDRLWVVTNRCEVVCLDTNGFRDGENYGDFITELNQTELDADVVWKFDMFNSLGVRPLHQAVSSVAVVDGVVLLNTSNGPDESRQIVPAPNAPNFLALDARTGAILWQDNSAGDSIIAGGSSCSCSGTSPAVATIGGVTQAIFAGREGWLHAFDFADLKQGKTTRLWRFDCNPKTSTYSLGGKSTRNTLVASPVIVGDHVYMATGRNPEEGEGIGDLWCIDATKRGDLSSELVFNNSYRDGREPIAHKPLCACDPQQGDFTRPNPNSGAVWHYVGTDRNGDGQLTFEETFHRSISSPAIDNGLLFIPDFSGLLHCVDARTGVGLWTADLRAGTWSSCVIADGKVLIGDEDGDMAIFQSSREHQPVHGDSPPNIGGPVFATPALVNDSLFVAMQNSLIALGPGQPTAPRIDEQANAVIEPKKNPLENQTQTVVGTVVSPDGKPVAGVEVLAFRGERQLDQTFITDEKGEFRVPKTWRETDGWLTAVARDGRDRLGWFDFMVHGHSDLGQKSADGSFKLVLLPMSRTIRGRVVDELGQPLSQIPVRINQLDHQDNLISVHWRYQKLGDGPLLVGAVTDNAGQFEMKLPADSTAWLAAHHPEWVEQPIRITTGADGVAEIKLIRAAKVAGRVIDARTGKSLAGVKIGAYAKKTEILQSSGDEVESDTNGNFLFQGLRPAEYTIQLQEGADSTLTAKAYSNVLLKAGETFAADFSLNVGKRLAGRVLDIDTGKPIADCKVIYTGPSHPAAGGLSTQTNEQGDFEFYVMPGEGILDATTDGRRFGDNSTRTVEVPVDGDAEAVVLEVGEKIETDPSSIRIFMGPPLDRKVSLKFEQTPLAEALDQLCSAAGMTFEFDKATLTKAGYRQDITVTLVEESPVTLEEGLTRVLEPYKKLVFTVVDNKVIVSDSPPQGLEFLKPYPKLHNLSLDMSEKEFLAIVKKQGLTTHKTAQGEGFLFPIGLGDGHTLMVMFRADGTCGGIQRLRGEDVANESVSLADLVRDFNAENQKLEQGLDQPPLTVDEVITAIQSSELDQWRRRGVTEGPGDPYCTEREFAVFRAIAETRQLPKEAYFSVWTSEKLSTFVIQHLWSIQLYLPSLDGDGFDGFVIRHTKRHVETIDPTTVAWGKPDVDGLSLGAYLSPRKDKYTLGERVQLRLFVRNEGKAFVETTWANTTHPMPEDFHITDEKGAKIAARKGEHWSEKWISGYMAGGLGPGDVHSLNVPYEISFGGDGSNRLVGRVIDARAGQTLKLQVSSHIGSNRERADNEPSPLSGVLTFAVDPKAE